MYCRKCGTELPNDAAFCSSCGTGTGVANSAEQSDTVATKVPIDSIKDKVLSHRKLFIVIAAVAIAVISIVFIFMNTGCRGAVDKYFSALSDKDFDKFVKYCLPDDVVEYAEEYRDRNYYEIVDDCGDFLEWTILDELENMVGKHANISYKIKETKKMSQDEIYEFQGEYGLDWYFDKYIKVYSWDRGAETVEFDITNGYKVDVIVTVKGDDDKEDFYSTVTVLKINGDWIVVRWRVNSIHDTVYRLESTFDDVIR